MIDMFSMFEQRTRDFLITLDLESLFLKPYDFLHAPFDNSL